MSFKVWEMSAITPQNSVIEGGAILIGVAEYEGGIYNKDGIDLEKLMAHRKQ